MHKNPPSYQLVEDRLGGSLEDFVREARLEADSWRDIATAVRERTGVRISPESLRGWFPQYRNMIAFLRDHKVGA